ncbi:Ribose-phosphate pyrophosphokinase 2 chloroplastic [Bienertia sinuspersici]
MDGPSVPIVDEQSLPKFLHPKCLENSVNRSSTRLKLFSGSANPALAKEIA